MWKEYNSHRIFFVHKHGRRFIVLYTNMAAVTSCENGLFVEVLMIMSREQQNFYFHSGLKEVQTFAKFWPYLKTYFFQVTQFVSCLVSLLPDVPQRMVLLSLSLLS